MRGTVRGQGSLGTPLLLVTANPSLRPGEKGWEWQHPRMSPDGRWALPGGTWMTGTHEGGCRAGGVWASPCPDFLWGW